MRPLSLVSSGVLQFGCPKCDEVLEVMVSISNESVEQLAEAQLRHMPARKHPVEFIAEAPFLHATFWGHMVRCHQPNPHPYMKAVLP